MQINQPSWLGNPICDSDGQRDEDFDDLSDKSSLKNTQLLIKTNYFKVASWDGDWKITVLVFTRRIQKQVRGLVLL